MKSWFYKNWSFGLTAIAILAGLYSTPFGLKFIYWLSILGRQYFLSFILFAWIVLVVALVIRSIGKLVKRPIYLREAAVVIMLVSNILVTIMAPVDIFYRLLNYRGHLQSTQLGFQVYHLSIDAADCLQPFYSLNRCDGLGIFCITVARIPVFDCEETLDKDSYFFMSAFMYTCERTTLQTDSTGGVINILEDGNVRIIYDP
jgi:hypothetical protein